MDVSVETVLDTRDPPDPESRMALNDEEEEKTRGVSSSDTRNLRNYRDFHRSEGGSRSCPDKAQHPNKSCSEFRQTVDCENDGGDRKTPTRGLEAENDLYSPVLKDEIRAVSVNGTVVLPQPVCHVTPLLQRPPNLSNSPTIAVPLHTRKYNPTLDSNPTLITCFSRFPYPTHAEFSWLTAVSRLPEEQIKVWFSTQRLKQGITWTPEEVEEARKKMFNGSIPTPRDTSPTPDDPTRQTGSGSNRSSGTSPALGRTLEHSSGSLLLASELKRPVVHMPLLITASPGFP